MDDFTGLTTEEMLTKKAAIWGRYVMVLGILLMVVGASMFVYTLVLHEYASSWLPLLLYCGLGGFGMLAVYKRHLRLAQIYLVALVLSFIGEIIYNIVRFNTDEAQLRNQSCQELTEDTCTQILTWSLVLTILLTSCCCACFIGTAFKYMKALMDVRNGGYMRTGADELEEDEEDEFLDRTTQLEDGK